MKTLFSFRPSDVGTKGLPLYDGQILSPERLPSSVNSFVSNNMDRVQLILYHVKVLVSNPSHSLIKTLIFRAKQRRGREISLW